MLDQIAYDEARSLLMETVEEKYISLGQIAAICRGLRAIDVLRAAARLDSAPPDLRAA